MIVVASCMYLSKEGDRFLSTCVTVSYVGTDHLVKWLGHTLHDGSINRSHIVSFIHWQYGCFVVFLQIRATKHVSEIDGSQSN